MPSARFDAATFDPATRAVTMLFLGLLLVVPGVVVILAGGQAIPLIVIGGAAAGGTWALSPKGYELDAMTLTVVRRLWPAYTAQVEGFAQHDEPERLGIRLAASGGPFGWFGRFRRRDLGTYRAFMTSLRPGTVLALSTDRGLVVISPADRAAMTAAIGTLLD